MKVDTVNRISTSLHQLETLALVLEDNDPSIALFIRSEVISLRDAFMLELITEEETK